MALLQTPVQIKCVQDHEEAFWYHSSSYFARLSCLHYYGTIKLPPLRRSYHCPRCEMSLVTGTSWISLTTFAAFSFVACGSTILLRNCSASSRMPSHSGITGNFSAFDFLLLVESVSSLHSVPAVLPPWDFEPAAFETCSEGSVLLPCEQADP